MLYQLGHGLFRKMQKVKGAWLAGSSIMTNGRIQMVLNFAAAPLAITPSLPTEREILIMISLRKWVLQRKG